MLYPFLQKAIPDVGVVLRVSPQAQLPMQMQKKQWAINSQGHKRAVVTLVAEPDIYVTLQWNYLTEAERNTILSIYYDPAKANGIANSFVWQYLPGDWYVVQFTGAWGESLSPSGAFSVSGLTLKVLGIFGGVEWQTKNRLPIHTKDNIQMYAKAENI